MGFSTPEREQNASPVQVKLQEEQQPVTVEIFCS